MTDNFLDTEPTDPASMPDQIEDSGSDTTKYSMRAKEETINRSALPQSVQDYAKNASGVQMWETDPQTLYDYSNNLLVLSFIDTIAKDVAHTDYSVSGNDSDPVQELLQDPHPTKTFSDLTEDMVTDLMRTGNAFLVVNRYSSGDPAELIVAPASTMFIVKDKNGIVQGYVQRIGRSQTNKIEKEDVIHVKWSNQPDRDYAIGPVEMSLDQIDIIDELNLKEILDLTEGGIASIVSQTESHDTDPMNSQEWDQFVNDVQSQRGERQHNVLAKGSFEETTLSTDYSNLELIERYKFHMNSISSAFKVNPSYVGFDFQNTNRATDESQRQSYKERGIKTTLEKFEQYFNKFLRREFGDAEFIWDMEAESDKDKVEYYQNLAEAVQELQKAGVEFEITDSNITIPEDAEIQDMDQLSKIEEVRMVSQLSDQDLNNVVDESTNTEEEKKDFDECVTSVMQDNPELSEEEAEAICASKKNELTQKQQEFVDSTDYDNFAEALISTKNNADSQRKAIEEIKNLTGSFSSRTYYNWLEDLDLR